MADEINFGGNKCSASLEGGILTLENGRTVNLIQMQADLNEMFQETGDNRLAALSNEISTITGLVQGPHGEWEELK